MTKNNKIVEEMFAVGAHFGYSKSKRHPSVTDHLLTNKDGLDIINLEKTADALEKAKEKIAEIRAKNKKMVLVATKHEIKDLAPELASADDIFYVNQRWIGGTLTNFTEIRKRVSKLIKLTEENEEGELAKYTKKEQLGIQKEIEKLKKYYQGLVGIKEKPAALIIVDSKAENIATQEALDTDIEIIAICNTDNDLNRVKLPIVANDRSRESIKYILETILN